MNTKKLKWKDAYSLAYHFIDGHHKKLLSLINDYRLILALPKDAYKKDVGKILKSLIAYIIYLFTEKEKLWLLMNIKT